mmetsp:Transcript_21234/g.49212  ORF Transcript_21234/g.49212 Transcript_21234/m.49212 type:complete len:300 (+) Transcript_21234:605-1504(+)
MMNFLQASLLLFGTYWLFTLSIPVVLSTITSSVWLKSQSVTLVMKLRKSCFSRRCCACASFFTCRMIAKLILVPTSGSLSLSTLYVYSVEFPRTYSMHFSIPFSRGLPRVSKSFGGGHSLGCFWQNLLTADSFLITCFSQATSLSARITHHETAVCLPLLPSRLSLQPFIACIQVAVDLYIFSCCPVSSICLNWSSCFSISLVMGEISSLETALKKRMPTCKKPPLTSGSLLGTIGGKKSVANGIQLRMKLFLIASRSWSSRNFTSSSVVSLRFRPMASVTSCAKVSVRSLLMLRMDFI